MQFCSQQSEVIRHQVGQPALVLAGAGSGKTATIVERAAQLVAQGVSGERILMMTFTNKAVEEMRERVFNRIKELSAELGNSESAFSLPEIYTYHSYGFELIRKYRLTYFDDYPTIMSDSDIRNELFKLLKDEMGVDFHKDMYEVIEEVYNQGGAGYLTTVERFKQIVANFKEGKFTVYHDGLYRTLKKYEAYKKAHNLLDFSDLINLPVHILGENQGLGRFIRDGFDEIIVDESQDTNASQFRLLMTLAKQDMKNVVMVGDDDQSIYEWRGAKPALLSSFRQVSGAVIYKIENNYRSLNHIVDAATALVRKNEARLEKTPRAVRRTELSKVPFNAHENMVELGEYIASSIANDIKNGAKPDDFAILYRTNRIGNFLQLQMIREGIPFEVRAGSDIMSKQENKLLTSMIRLSVNPKDAPAFRTFSDYLPGVGPKTADEIIKRAMNSGKSIFEQEFPRASRIAVEGLRSKLGELYEGGPIGIWDFFWANMKVHLIKIVEKDVKAANSASKHSDLSDEEKFEKFFKARQDNIKLVYGAIKARVEALGDVDLEVQWKEALSLVIQPPQHSNALETNKKPRVTLSTYHGSKGLQWKKVFVAGFSQGLMPMAKGLNFEKMDVDNLEEERRLAYVAITRAVDEVELCHSKRYDLVSGGLYAKEVLPPSQFAFEILESLEHNEDELFEGQQPRAEARGLR